MGVLKMKQHLSYLSIGSNMGDPAQNCCRGIDLLCQEDDIALVKRSPFYRTAPVDYLDQEWFVNAALLIKTELTPHTLMARTQAVQDALGRKTSAVRFGPRILDLDIIFYGDRIVKTAELVIPHPRMHKRHFVLQPICDIDPNVVHPVLGLSVQEMLNQLVKDGQDIQPCSLDC